MVTFEGGGAEVPRPDFLGVERHHQIRYDVSIADLCTCLKMNSKSDFTIAEIILTFFCPTPLKKKSVCAPDNKAINGRKRPKPGGEDIHINKTNNIGAPQYVSQVFIHTSFINQIPSLIS